MECENESDGEDRLSERSDHWKVSCHVWEVSSNVQGNDTADAGAKEDENERS